MSHLKLQILTTRLENTVALHHQHKPIRLPGALLEHKNVLRSHWGGISQDFHDGPSVSVQSITVNKEGVEANTAEASFFQILYSNLSMDLELPGDTSIRKMLSKRHSPLGTEYIQPHNTGVITHFLLPFGNPLKIAIGVVTADDKLLCVRRSHHPKIAVGRGNLQCTVGTQVKCCEQRFLNHGKPSVELSALQGMSDEIGEELTAICTPLVCTGVIISREHFVPSLLFETTCPLSAMQFVERWHKASVRDRHEVDEIIPFDLSSADPILDSVCESQWSTHHAACALHVLLQRHLVAAARAGYAPTLASNNY
ncbi:MAG: hypothetical protein Q7S57_05415 [bacterium]|nr:hypothetical protein [bacterium]